MVRANQRRKDALASVQREQIVEGFAAAIAAKGYQATTIADIAANARVSKTTFYDHFPDKEAVFLALHATVAETTVAAIARRQRETAEVADWRARLRHVIDGYLDAMADTPAFLLQVMAEAAVASPATRAARAEALDRFAALLVAANEQAARAVPGIRPIAHDLAVATMAGVLELVSRAAPRGPEAVRALAPSVVELMARVAAPGVQPNAKGRAGSGDPTRAAAPRAVLRPRAPRRDTEKRSAR